MAGIEERTQRRVHIREPRQQPGRHLPAPAPSPKTGLSSRPPSPRPRPCRTPRRGACRRSPPCPHRGMRGPSGSRRTPVRSEAARCAPRGRSRRRRWKSVATTPRIEASAGRRRERFPSPGQERRRGASPGSRSARGLRQHRNRIGRQVGLQFREVDFQKRPRPTSISRGVRPAAPRSSRSRSGSVLPEKSWLTIGPDVP